MIEDAGFRLAAREYNEVAGLVLVRKGGYYETSAIDRNFSSLFNYYSNYSNHLAPVSTK